MFKLNDLLADAICESAEEQTRGADLSLEQRQSDLKNLAAYFAQHPSEEHLLSGLIEESIRASEERIRRDLEGYEMQARSAEATLHMHLDKQSRDNAKQERRARIESIVLTVISLIVGWCLSLIGSPLELIRHFI